MKRSIAFLYVAGLFLLGILIGALATHLWYAQRPSHRPFGPRGGMRPPAHEMRRGPGHRPGPFFLERIGRQLDLSPEQEQRIAEIIEESHREAGALHEEILPRVEAQLEQTRQRILEVLTPEQRERFEEFHRRHRRVLERGVLGH
jgi:Spy/CpxP family protein refolding chaperone